MSEEIKLWKTTIEIITDYDPLRYEIEDLVREATSGDAYCIGKSSESISPDELEDDCREFFNCSEDEESQ